MSYTERPVVRQSGVLAGQMLIYRASERGRTARMTLDLYVLKLALGHSFSRNGASHRLP
jgi:hypothetical protein